MTAPVLVRHVLASDGSRYAAAEVVDDALSVVWTERWQDYGEAQVRLPPTHAFALGDLVAMPGRDMAAEVVAMTETEAGMELRCRDALSVLDRRIVYPTVSNNGLVSTFVSKLLANGSVVTDGSASTARTLPPVRAGDLSAIAGSAQLQRSYGQLGETLLDVGRAYGFDPTCALSGGHLVVGARVPSASRVWGVGRSLAGYVEDSDVSEARNVAYVGAQIAQGGSRVVRATGDVGATGMGRRETFVDRRDIALDGMDRQAVLDQYGEIASYGTATFTTVTRGSSAPYEVIDVWMSANVYTSGMPLNATMMMAETLGNTALVSGMVAASYTGAREKTYYGTYDSHDGGWRVTLTSPSGDQDFVVPVSVLPSASFAVSPQAYGTVLGPIGRAALADLQPETAFEATVEGLEPYTDYALGDAVTVYKADGSSRSMRVVEVVESWDSQGYRATPGLASL